MRIHPHARTLLIVAGLATAFGIARERMVVCFALLAATYLFLGCSRMFVRYLTLIAPFMMTAAALWIFVYYGAGVDLRAATYKLLEPRSSFLALARTMLGTSVIFLALRAVPDGEIYSVLRRMGLPRNAALVFASGNALITTIGDALERSLVALRAQGMMRASTRSRVLNIGRALSLTWLTGLTVTALRAEVKWDGNGFFKHLESRPMPVSIATRDTAIATIAAIGMLVLVFFPLRTLVDASPFL